MTKSPEYERRTTCRSCGSVHLKDVLSLGNQRVVGFGSELPPRVPLDLTLCDNCHLLQLRHTTRSDLLWGDEYGYRSGVNETMKNELADIAHCAEKMVKLEEVDIAVDIGCNDGTLLSSYNAPLITVGFDPSINVARYAEAAGHDVIFDYFTKEKYPHGKKAKIVTAVAMFYDLDDPNKFVQDVADVLDEEGVFVIQQNYLKGMIDQCAFDNICHEHLEYYSLLSLTPLLQRHGLEVFDVKTSDINGGSFRTYIRHMGSYVGTDWGLERVSQMLVGEIYAGLDKKETYEAFADRVKTNGHDLQNLINSLVAFDKKVYVYGASTRGGTLLQFMHLGKEQLVAAADRNPDKWGKIMQTTGLPIVSEEEGRANADYFLVLPWFFKTEMVQREKEFLSRGGRMIFPLPKLEVVG